jgi:6,7-dimethyl-8-ribityllumazine synthase
VNTGWRKRSGEQQVGMDQGSVERNHQERSVGVNFRTVDCLGTVIRGTALQFEFDSLQAAHSDQDIAGGDPLPVSDTALTTGSHGCARDCAAGRRGNKG